MTRFLLAIIVCAPLRAAQPWTLEDLFAWREISEARIQPDGARVAWVETVRNRDGGVCESLWISAITPAEPRRLNDGACHETMPRWTPEGHDLAFLSQGQIWVRGRLTHLDSPPLAFAWSTDGATIAYTARLPETPAWAPASILAFLRTGPPRTGLFVIPAAGGPPVRVPTGKLDVFGEPAWMPDGKSILISAAEPGGDPEIYSIPLNLGGARQISRHNGPDFAPLPSPDGSRLAWIARDAKLETYATAKLYVSNPDGSRARVLAGTLDRDVTHIQWSSDSRTVYFLADDRGASHIWAARNDGNFRQVTTARERLTDFSLADNGRAVIVRSPGQLVTFPADVPGTAAIIVAPNAALLDARATSGPEEVHFTSAGRDIQGWLLKPPAFDRARKYPLLLDVQDAPRRMCGVEFNLREQIFAARGFVVLCANPRGTPGFGEEFASLLRTRNPGDDFDDLMRGADHLSAQGFIDSTRVHLIGGLLAAWAIGHTDRLRSVVAVDPIVVFGDPQHSPIFFADSFKTPTLVIDSGIGPGAAELYAALQSRHVESALLTSPAALQLEAILAWLR